MNEISSRAFKFMSDLWNNNSKEWFDENRERYANEVREPIKQLALDLNGPVSMMLPEQTEKPKISRINNDLRFVKNKPLYKEHVWVKFGIKPAELFAAISRNGWCAGVSIGSPKRADLDMWRKNLIKHADAWQRYMDAINLGVEVQLHVADSYKKPLYDNIPENVFDLVQAKTHFYIFQETQPTLSNLPVKDIFYGLALMLPAYLFMSVEGAQLSERLSELGTVIEPPFPEIGKIWDAVNGR
jgi:uncharacterized protein (TIGR02453 family)